jgi:hypothetical protein
VLQSWVLLSLRYPTLACRRPDYFNNLIEQLGLSGQVSQGDSLKSTIIKIIENTDVNIINEKLLKLSEDNNNDLNSILQKYLTSRYIYRIWNSIVHEGGSFSFDIVGLSKVLQKYLVELIKLFSQD